MGRAGGKAVSQTFCRCWGVMSENWEDPNQDGKGGTPGPGSDCPHPIPLGRDRFVPLTKGDWSAPVLLGPSHSGSMGHPFLGIGAGLEFSHGS